MIAYCNFIPDAVWIRELENGIRRITLRRNFTEEIIIKQGENEKQFRFEETDAYIPERDNIQEFITNNFGNLFDLGLIQVEEKEINEIKIRKANEIVNNGVLIDDLQDIGKQITNLMLGV